MIVTATTEIIEMTLMKFFFRLETRYRWAIKSGRFKTSDDLVSFGRRWYI